MNLRLIRVEQLALTIVWSTVVSVFTHKQRTMHPGIAIFMDFGLFGVHYAFVIINALSANLSKGWGHGNAIVAVFLLVLG